MGLSYSFTCSKCNRKVEIINGIGMLYSPYTLTAMDSKHNLLSHYKNGINANILKELLNSGGYVLDDNYSIKNYQCPKCKEIYSHLDFKLISLKKDDKTTFKSEYKCPKCNEKLKLLDKIDKCPYCGGNFDADKTEMILWD